MHKLLILAQRTQPASARGALQLAVEWREACGGGIELWRTADGDAAAWAACATEFAADLKVQPVGTPAARAWVALCLCIAAGDVPLLVLDHAALTLANLNQAGVALGAHELVLTPDAHGAVALIGLRRAVPELFAGTPDGLLLTSLRARARWRGVSLEELPAATRA
jgi:glycosyltransferase A (GT-A) superfamily protein (DUF2064 family)